MQWTPDAVSWFNYSSGAAVFNAAQRASLTPLTLNIASANVITRIAPVQSDSFPRASSSTTFRRLLQCHRSDGMRRPVHRNRERRSSHAITAPGRRDDRDAGLGRPSRHGRSTRGTPGPHPAYGHPLGVRPHRPCSAVLRLARAGVLGREIETHEQECSGQLRPGIVSQPIERNPGMGLHERTDSGGPRGPV